MVTVAHLLHLLQHSIELVVDCYLQVLAQDSLARLKIGFSRVAVWNFYVKNWDKLEDPNFVLCGLVWRKLFGRRQRTEEVMLANEEREAAKREAASCDGDNATDAVEHITHNPELPPVKSSTESADLPALKNNAFSRMLRNKDLSQAAQPQTGAMTETRAAGDKVEPQPLAAPADEPRSRQSVIITDSLIRSLPGRDAPKAMDPYPNVD